MVSAEYGKRFDKPEYLALMVEPALLMREKEAITASAVCITEGTLETVLLGTVPFRLWKHILLIFNYIFNHKPDVFNFCHHFL